VCKYKSAQGYGLLKVIKIHSTPSFRGEVRLDAPCCKILQQVKKPLVSMNKNTFQGQIFILLSHSFCLLPDVSAGRIARVWWTNQEFSLNGAGNESTSEV
jgi:hypothetical protein